MAPQADDSRKPRWLYRFDNYKRAFGLLREAMETLEVRELTQLEKEGVIQRFEYTWELAWKLIKDYLEHEGIVLDKITPASVLRAALQAKVIDHGERWMQALDARNKMSHTYDFDVFEATIQEIQKTYLGLFDTLHVAMMEVALEGPQTDRLVDMAADHGLSGQQLQTIHDILRPWAHKIAEVGLFGSRATGNYRPYSDIDLILYGEVEASDIDRLHTLFEESSLPMEVDVNAWNLITDPPLKAHVKSVMRPLFGKADGFGGPGA